MRRNSVLVLLSVLLGMSFVGCESCDEAPAEDDGVSEVMERWERKVERARAGLPTDFDDDGFEEYLQWADKDGVIHVELKSPDGDFYFVSELHPDETRITRYDVDGDGIFDQRMEEKPDGGRVYFFDTDDDEVFDERVTIAYKFDKNEQDRVFEKLQTDGSWIETRRDTVPIHPGATLLSKTEVDSGMPANFLHGFDMPPNATLYNPTEYESIKNNLEVKTTGEGACGGDQIAKIKKAFNSIFDGAKALECLSRTNPEIGERLRQLVNKPVHASIECGRPSSLAGDAGVKTGCAKTNEAGNCIKPTCGAVGSCKMTIKDSAFGESDASFMALMLHEYLHLLGFQLDPKHNDPKDEENYGNDIVTACGEYCGGCPSFETTACTNCAAGKDKKSAQRQKQCDPYDQQWQKGIKEVLKTGDCPKEFGQALWHCQNVLKCVGTPCKTCQWTEYTDCKGNPTTTPEKLGRLLCCDACPSECEGEPITLSCKGKNYSMQNTCTDSEGPLKDLPPTVAPFCPGGIKNPQTP